jgi:selenide,water dikinase
MNHTGRSNAFHCLTRVEMNIRGGCQCKFPGLELADMLSGAIQWASESGAPVALPPSPEDCALVEASGQRLLISTDIAPIVGVDLRAAGRIAALHAMSDIYASGGIPKWALVNLVVQTDRPAVHAQAVLAGILEQCALEGAPVLGGQTIMGPEALAGLTVGGTPRSRLLRKGGARPGDTILLSKPLGVGLILRAYKLAQVDESVLAKAITVMSQSNADASAAAVEAGVHAATDVTGFGLLGHLAEMLAPNLGATVELSRIPKILEPPLLPHTVPTVWIQDNHDYADALCPLRGTTGLQDISILLDPQTNGGLLVTADDHLTSQLESRGFTAIGRVSETHSIEVAA